MDNSPVQRIYQYISRYFTPLFWTVFVAAFFVAFIQIKDKTYLTNATAPHGIVSLELGWTGAKDSAIIQSWKADTSDPLATNECQTSPLPINRLQIARFDTYLDYLFIFLYTALAIIIIASLQTNIRQAGTPFSNLLLALAIIAGLCDCVENGGLLNFISEGIEQQGNAPPAASTFAITATITSIAASIKFSILFLLLIIYLPLTLIFKDKGLIRLSDYIRAKSLQLFKYRIILLGVLIFSAPIWLLDQGQDLLINSNSSNMGVILFLTVVLIAAILNWYLAKLFFEKTYIGPVYPVQEPILADPVCQATEKKVSRILGIATILIPSVAILNAMNAIRVHFPLNFFPPVIWLISLLALFFALVKFDIAGNYYIRKETQWGKKKINAIALIIIIFFAFVLPLLIRFSFINDNPNTPKSLFFLFLHLLFLSFSFYIFVSIRTYVFNDSGWWGRMIGWPVILTGGTLAVLFILINFFPLSILTIDRPYLSLPVLLSGVVFYTLTLTLLIRISLSKKINFVLIGFVIGLIISITAVNDYHAVDMRQVTASPQPVALTDYYRQWILHRQKEIVAAPSEYPVFIINSYGGGIRAAAFTNMVITYLDSIMLTKGLHGFEHYVFSISGASGGTIGAAIQCAFRANLPDTDRNGHSNSNKYTLEAFQQFYRHDFLTPVLSNMLGRDIWASATSLHLWKDRSEIQERLWEGFGSSALGVNLDKEFNAIWNTADTSNHAPYEVPLLFSNTLNVDDGLKGIMAPVTLAHNDFPASIFIRERIDALNRTHAKGKDSIQSIFLMTGAFLSARFPFISPSGKMGPGYHFMDGGGKDNSGASTSEDIFLSLARYKARQNPKGPDSILYRLMDKVHFYFVSISNSPYYDPDSNRRLVANRFEPISPLIGIINSGISGNARAADSTIRFRYATDSGRYLGISADYCRIYPTATCVSDQKGDPYAPVLPLGWQISEPSLQRLRQSFTDNMIRYYDSDGIRKVLRIVNLQPPGVH